MNTCSDVTCLTYDRFEVTAVVGKLKREAVKDGHYPTNDAAEHQLTYRCQ